MLNGGLGQRKEKREGKNGWPPKVEVLVADHDCAHHNEGPNQGGWLVCKDPALPPCTMGGNSATALMKVPIVSHFRTSYVVFGNINNGRPLAGEGRFHSKP